MSAKSQEGMRGGIVWVCERGHVDMLHMADSTECMTCRAGSTEPRFTPGRRSKAQRDRDKQLGQQFPRFEEERSNRRKRRPVARPPLPTTVKVSRPGEPDKVVEAEEFDPPAPTPPFTLTAEQRHQVLHGIPPRLAFPRERPDDVPADMPYPASAGDVLEVTDRVRLVVLGTHTPNVSEVEILYEVHDRRVDYADPVRAFKPADERVPIFTLGGATVGEGEPQPITKAEATQVADQVHQRELETLRRVRRQHEANLEELASQPRDVRFPIRKTVEALNFRISEIEKQLGAPKRKTDLNRRRMAEAEEEESQERQRERREVQQRRNAPGTTPDEAVA